MPKNIGSQQAMAISTELGSVSPNGPDQNSYTPMHAAASYGHVDVLEYLISKGGDVNITDDDGDTPLYTVENIETAKWLIDHGSVVDRRNSEGISHLQEEFEEVAAYVQTRSALPPVHPVSSSPAQPSQHSQDVASEQLTSELMATVHQIMQPEQSGQEVDEAVLRTAVTRAVLGGVATGYQLADDNDSPAKRSRTA
ncbi:ankyrin repeat-containing domain protein [Coprinopsis sp. MPI-PUGE-AT-0042]|nr:ankyrin repeat-containing domain protein [Coprinopsis sp. MPI-PUGE-AT-0042]